MSTSYSGLMNDLNKLDKEKLYTGDTYFCTDTYEVYRYDGEEWYNMYTISGTTLNNNSLTATTGTINTITEATLDFDDIFEQMAKRFNRVPTIEHKCHNCGGTLEIKANDGIFKCPYCKSCYAIGTSRINWKY